MLIESFSLVVSNTKHITLFTGDTSSRVDQFLQGECSILVLLTYYYSSMDDDDWFLYLLLLFVVHHHRHVVVVVVVVIGIILCVPSLDGCLLLSTTT